MGRDKVEIKGHHLRATQVLVAELWGAQVHESLVVLYTERFRRALLSGALVSSGWYPIDWLGEVYEGLGKLPPGESGVPERIGRASAENDLTGLYRFILKLSSPELIARHFDKVVSAYLRGGTVESRVEGCTMRAELRGWSGVTWPIWQACLSGFEVVLNTTGIHNLASQIREAGPGCLIGDFRWEKLD